jgi:hypothetical protein
LEFFSWRPWRLGGSDSELNRQDAKDAKKKHIEE